MCMCMCVWAWGGGGGGPVLACRPQEMAMSPSHMTAISHAIIVLIPLSQFTRVYDAQVTVSVLPQHVRPCRVTFLGSGDGDKFRQSVSGEIRLTGYRTYYRYLG